MILGTAAPAGLPRWWTQDQAVLLQPAVIKTKACYGDVPTTTEPVESVVPSNWWQREKGVLQQILPVAAAPKTCCTYATEFEGRPLAPKEQLRHPIAAEPLMPSVVTEVNGRPLTPEEQLRHHLREELPMPHAPVVEATPGLPTWWERESEAVMDATHLIPKRGWVRPGVPTIEVPSPKTATTRSAGRSASPSLSPDKQLRKWLTTKGPVEKWLMERADSLNELLCAGPRSKAVRTGEAGADALAASSSRSKSPVVVGRMSPDGLLMRDGSLLRAVEVRPDGTVMGPGDRKLGKLRDDDIVVMT